MQRGSSEKEVGEDGEGFVTISFMKAGMSKKCQQQTPCRHVRRDRTLRLQSFLRAHKHYFRSGRSSGEKLCSVCPAKNHESTTKHIS
jgi:hypothetical protein